MNVNPVDVVGTVIVGAVLLNLLWDLICYELRIHFANSYVVKINYHDAYGSKDDVCYAIKSLDEDDACLQALQIFKKKSIRFNQIDHINAVKVNTK